MTITFGRRFRGPLSSANGGYAAGCLAAYVPADAVEVTLRLPPPLDRPLEVRREDGAAVSLLDGDGLVAEARPASLDLDLPAPPSLREAQEGAERHVSVGSELFRECFVCGVRADGDGLGIYAGPVPRREPLHTAPWTPSESSPAVVWAAIDCPGAYAVGAAGRGEIVLGRMAARVLRAPEAGEPCVVGA